MNTLNPEYITTLIYHTFFLNLRRHKSIIIKSYTHDLVIFFFVQFEEKMLFSGHFDSKFHCKETDRQTDRQTNGRVLNNSFSSKTTHTQTFVTKKSFASIKL